jgi:hypothetical protein
MVEPLSPTGDLPAFDRRFFGGPERLTRIGDGSIGGKALGLVSARSVLTDRLGPAAIRGFSLEVPTLTVIGTAFFEQFVDSNDLSRYLSGDETDDAVAFAFQQGNLPVELLGDLRALVQQVRVPLAVRSSSLMEDALRRPFAGVYATKMIPNNAPDADQRFRSLVEAVKLVWASTWFSGARAYHRAAGCDVADERMAVILQEVVGWRRGNRYYPEISGVARSFNFYSLGRGSPSDGVADLALGLGKTIVDGGLCWTFNPARPKATAPFSSPADLLRKTQTSFWAVNMGRPPAYDPIRETEYLVRCSLADADYDGALRYLASTYDPGSDRLSPGVGRDGPRAMDFAPLLVLEELPLASLVRRLLEAFEEAAGLPVEIEFAITLERAPARPARLGFLQVRPLVVSEEEVEVTDEELDSPLTLASSASAMGNGVLDGIEDVVYVKPAGFESRHTRAVAEELAALNHRLGRAARPYLLVGFGRWGSSDPWLGIPVSWASISGARAIVEATLPAMNVDPSQGSHFFHNLSSFRVGYLTVRHDRDPAIDWGWMDAQPAEDDLVHVRHVRLDAPLRVKVDGRSGRAAVLRRRPTT